MNLKLIETKMNFREIIEKSLKNVNKFRYFWGLGFLAMLTSCTSSFQGYNGSPSDKEFNYESFTNWFSLHASLIILIAIISIAIGAVIIYLSLRAQAGQILATKKIEEGSPFKKFSEVFAGAEGYAVSFFVLGLLYFLVVLVWALMTIFLPAILMALIPNVFIYIFGGLLMAIGVVGTVLLAIGIPVSYMYGQRLIVLQKQKVIDAFEGGIRLVRHNLANSILALLIQFLIGIVVIAVIFFAMFLLLCILSLFGWGIYALIGTIATIIYGFVLGLPILAVCLLLGAILNSFYSYYWTLIFLKLKK
jgi:hypothetical protein